MHNNGANGLLVDVAAQSSLPGPGASGGLGGTGGLGGAGGCGGGRGCAGQSNACDRGWGGNGGRGGNGGNGGNGGPGVLGLAQDFYQDPAGTAPAIATFQSPDEPKIFVRSSGCSYRTVKAWIDAAGYIVWFFGPGSTPPTAVGDTVTTQYTTLGRKSLSVIVNGQTYTFYEFIDIRDDGTGTNPTFSLSQDTVCLGGQITFTSSLNTAQLYEWDFGGGASPTSGSTQISVTQIFNTPGTFVVTHRAYTPCCGWSEPARDTVVVLPDPTPTITITTLSGSTSVCADEPVTFIARLQNFAGVPPITWYVGGAPAGSGPTFTWTTPASGIPVQAVATGNTPCTRGQPIPSNTLTLTVNPRPVIQPLATGCFNITGNLIPNEFITLSATASGGTPPYTFYWDLGDGRGAVGNPATVLYPLPGTYQLRLTVVDANGCRSSNTAACETTLTISYRPIADFTASPLAGCPPLTVTFTNTSAFSNAYIWDFGDGNTSTALSPEHTYTTSGEYTVTLYAISASGTDTAISQRQVVVYPRPVADFSVFPPILYEADTAYFVSQSQGATSWLWFFGDPLNPGASSTSPNPAYFYAQPGRYTVTLIVENLYGCKDTLTRTDYVIKLPNPAPSYLPLNFTREAIRIYPNPFSEYLLLYLPEAMSFTLYEATGQAILSREAPAGTYRLATEGLSAGIYFLRVGPWTYKITKSL